MRIPQFLKFEFDDNGPRLFPTAVAWSLADGQIKYVILMPEDEWLGEDPEERILDDDYFRTQGVAPIDVLREMNEDLAEVTVFIDGLDPDEQMLELLCESLNTQPTFEIAHLSRLLRHLSPEELMERHRDLMIREGMDPQIAENSVYVQLLLAREEGLVGDNDA